MSRVVPSKLTSYSALPQGVSNKQLEISYASILPSNSSSSAQFAPDGTNRMLFRVPAFANCFLDNSRSSLSFTFKVNNAAADTTGNGLLLNPYLGTTSIFKRMILKSAQGLVIEDIVDLHILNKILLTMQPVSETRISEGILTGDHYMETEVSAAQKTLLNTAQIDGVRYQYFFNIGILSRHLKQFIPLHSLNTGTGQAFSIELWLNDNYNVLTKLGSGTADSAKSYNISDVKYNMTLLKADESIISRFNNLANESSELVIPFTTYRTYNNSLNGSKATLQVTEACSDLRRVHSVILSTSSETQPVDTKYSTNMSFIGGCDHSSTSVTSYQLQVGTKFIYNEPIVSAYDNNDLLQQVQYASYSKLPISATRLKKDDTTPLYQTEDFTLTSCFTFDDPNSYTNGISLGSLPLVLKLELSASASSALCQTFSELGFDLVIKDGTMMVRDRKDVGDFGY